MKKILVLLTSSAILFGVSNVFAKSTENKSESTQLKAKQKQEKLALSNPSKVIIATSSKPEFTLTLKSNPSTGFSWYLIGDYNANLIKPISHKFHAPKTKLVGASGYETFTFRVNDEAFNVPQRFTIKLQHIRPWVVVNNTQKMTYTIVTTEKPVTEVKQTKNQ